MKKLHLLALLLATSSYSQRIAINKIDEFTDAHIIKVDASSGKNWSGSDNITKGLFNNTFLSSKFISAKEKVIFLTLNLQLGTDICLSPEDGSIIILFSDKSKMELEQVSDLECNQNLTVDYVLDNTFENQLFHLDELSSKLISKIRIHTTKGYLDFEIKEKKQQIIKNHFKILQTEILKFLDKK